MKYDCDACGPELGSYLLGDVAAAVRREINTHLAACPACRNELERERELRAGLASLPLATCPDDVSARVLAVVGRESVAARRGARRWLGAGAAAGLPYRVTWVICACVRVCACACVCACVCVRARVHTRAHHVGRSFPSSPPPAADVVAQTRRSIRRRAACA